MKFVSITKPGIIFGNIVSVLGGFFLGSYAVGATHLSILFSTIVGMSLVIASGCVLNNVIDKDIDALMERTRRRVMPQHRMSPNVAIGYACVLGTAGLFFLYFYTNILTYFVALVGLFVYVVGYSLWFKRESVYGTVIGGIAGAVPPVAGYCAVTNRFDLGAILLFLILFFWQLPHFYAIAIFRLKDFSAAKIPVLPFKKSIFETQVRMCIYIAFFALASVSPFFAGYASLKYFCIALSLSIFWFFLGLSGFQEKNPTSILKWSRKMFLFSIINITLLCLAMSLR